MMFGIVMFLATLALALSAGYLSVMGFAMTFSNTFWQAFALAASLEVGKLVAASFLYRYWKSVSWSMRTGMTTAVVGLMLFTSAGIYSYLSASYQSSSVGLNVNTQRVTMLEEERQRSIDRKKEIDAQITNLPADYVKAREKLQKSFGPEQERLTKRIADIDAEMLTLKQQTVKDEAHVGPVIFVAKTFGIDSDKAINWFILLVVLVFDPLAVMMTLGTNHVLLDKGMKRKSEDEPVETANTDPFSSSGVWDNGVQYTYTADEKGSPELDPIPDAAPDRLKGIEDSIQTIAQAMGKTARRDVLMRNIMKGRTDD